MAVQPANEKPAFFSALNVQLPFSRRAFWGGALLLVALEVLASWARSQFLPNVPFFRLTLLWLGLAFFKGLLFGPVLGILTLQIVQLWKRKRWDDACYLCLRGGFALCSAQALWTLCTFLIRSYFPVLTWMVASWPNFALWLTLNGALLWALLLLVAGFLLPSDSRNTIQVSENTRF